MGDIKKKHKERIGIIFGGRSGEHDVSIMSASAVLHAMDKEKYQPVPIGIDREGEWYLANPEILDIDRDTWKDDAKHISIGKLNSLVDFVFPVVHGTLGEDGTLQGLLEILDIPYAGAGVLASAICMDKAMAKDIFVQNDIPTCKYMMVRAEDLDRDMPGIVKEICEKFKGTFFVKPANAGSSLGISRVEDPNDIGQALALAGSFDRRILVEEAVDGREIEVGVIGNESPIAAVPGEVTAGESFEYYDFEAKYSDSSGTRLDIPADIPTKTANKIRKLAIKAYLACDCSGFSRVDFFVDRNTGKILLNEINTIPGLTKYSLFPLMWEAAGVGFTELIDRIVEYGHERYNNQNSRKTIRRR